jgi:hypothetical protein
MLKVWSAIFLACSLLAAASSLGHREVVPKNGAEKVIMCYYSSWYCF